jgi:hypothetical protein
MMFLKKSVSTFPDHALTAGSTANNTGFTGRDKADPIAAPVKQPYRAALQFP